MPHIYPIRKGPASIILARWASLTKATITDLNWGIHATITDLTWGIHEERSFPWKARLNEIGTSIETHGTILLHDLKTQMFPAQPRPCFSASCLLNYSADPLCNFSVQLPGLVKHPGIRVFFPRPVSAPAADPCKAYEDDEGCHCKKRDIWDQKE